MREKEEREAAAAAKATEEVSESRSTRGSRKEETPDEDKLSGDDGGEDADDDASDSLSRSRAESEPEPEPESRTRMSWSAWRLRLSSRPTCSIWTTTSAPDGGVGADFNSDDAKGNVSARIEEEAERAVADLDDDDLT